MEVARCLFYQVLKHAEARGGEALLKVVLPHYRARAAEWVDRYEHVSLINGLIYERTEEESAVQAFALALERLIAGYSSHGMVVPGMRAGVKSVLAGAPEVVAQLRVAALEL
jgi:glucosyl-3-phosphoglycerate synthase